MHFHNPTTRKLSRKDKRSCRNKRSEKRNEDFHTENLRTAKGDPQLDLRSLISDSRSLPCAFRIPYAAPASLSQRRLFLSAGMFNIVLITLTVETERETEARSIGEAAPIREGSDHASPAIKRSPAWKVSLRASSPSASSQAGDVTSHGRRETKPGAASDKV
jgi:hypothetical protein